MIRAKGKGKGKGEDGVGVNIWVGKAVKSFALTVGCFLSGFCESKNNICKFLLYCSFSHRKYFLVNNLEFFFLFFSFSCLVTPKKRDWNCCLAISLHLNVGAQLSLIFERTFR